MCEHKKVLFSGIQETLNPEKSLLLFRCLSCNTTISLDTQAEYEIILNRMETEINSKKSKNVV